MLVVHDARQPAWYKYKGLDPSNMVTLSNSWGYEIQMTNNMSTENSPCVCESLTEEEKIPFNQCFYCLSCSHSHRTCCPGFSLYQGDEFETGREERWRRKIYAHNTILDKILNCYSFFFGTFSLLSFLQKYLYEVVKMVNSWLMQTFVSYVIP